MYIYIYVYTTNANSDVNSIDQPCADLRLFWNALHCLLFPSHELGQQISHGTRLSDLVGSCDRCSESKMSLVHSVHLGPKIFSAEVQNLPLVLSMSL